MGLPVDRKALSNRASFLRSRRKKGFELTTDQERELADWDAMKNPNMGRTPAHKKAKPLPPISERTTPAKLSQLDQTRTEAKPASPSPITKEGGDEKPSDVQDTLTPEKPPEIISPKGKIKGDWRAQYGSEQMTREQACTMGAKLWVSGLKKMNAQIRDMEKKPFLDDKFLDDEIYNACVLTVDKILPGDLEITPQVTAAAGTTVVLAQRVTLGIMAGKKKAPEKPILEVVKDVATPKDVEKKEKAEVDREKHREVDQEYKMEPGDVV